MKRLMLVIALISVLFVGGIVGALSRSAGADDGTSAQVSALTTRVAELERKSSMHDYSIGELRERQLPPMSPDPSLAGFTTFNPAYSFRMSCLIFEAPPGSGQWDLTCLRHLPHATTGGGEGP